MPMAAICLYTLNELNTNLHQNGHLWHGKRMHWLANALSGKFRWYSLATFLSENLLSFYHHA